MCLVSHALLVGNDIPLISTGSFKNIYITERESQRHYIIDIHILLM